MITAISQFVYNVLIAIWGLLPIHDLGLAIIFASVLIRLALWPLDKKSLHGRKALQELQPEMTKIKEKAMGDKQLESKLIMELYKEKEINPIAASCLPLIIQAPILFALFHVFTGWLKPEVLAEKTYPFIQNIPFVAEAIANPSLFQATLFGLDISAFGRAGIIFAIFPFAAAILQYIQVSMIQPKYQNMDEQQKIFAKLIYLGPVMIFFFGLNLPIALALYWIVTSVVAIIQQRTIMFHDVEELEEIVEKASEKDKKKKSKKKKPKK